MKTHLREDKTCRNCGHVVEKRYCPNCGQENHEENKSFHHLFTHFIEDLTHYDSSFWKTIKALLFRPGRLTAEYLAGKRRKYVPPVKLYIFINFLTFFLLSILPKGSADADLTFNEDDPRLQQLAPQERDSVVDALRDSNARENAATPGADEQDDGDFFFDPYISQRQMDSIEATLPESERASGFDLWLLRKTAKAHEGLSREEFKERVMHQAVNNLPKALFLYMPFFALGLWLVHGKKRWFYFDHGIFTLHYFSFVLLTFSIFLIFEWLLSYSDSTDPITLLLVLAMLGWWFFYFFRSHRRFYMEKRWISRLKGFFLFIVNMAILVFFMLGLLVVSALFVK